MKPKMSIIVFASVSTVLSFLLRRFRQAIENETMTALLIWIERRSLPVSENARGDLVTMSCPRRKADAAEEMRVDRGISRHPGYEKKKHENRTT